MKNSKKLNFSLGLGIGLLLAIIIGYLLVVFFEFDVSRTQVAAVALSENEKITKINYRPSSAVIPNQSNPFELQVRYSSKETRPVVLYIHGGGWKNGDKGGTINSIGKTFYSEGYAFVTMNYRLWQEASKCDTCKVGAQANDIEAAIKFIYKHSDRYNLDTSNLTLMGHSAGGHLASLGFLKAVGNGRLEAGSVKKIIALDTPVFDYQSFNELGRKSFLEIFGKNPQMWSQTSALSWLQKISDKQNLPSFYITSGKYNNNQAVIFDESLREANVTSFIYNDPERTHGDFITAFNEDVFHQDKLAGEVFKFLELEREVLRSLAAVKSDTIDYEQSVKINLNGLTWQPNVKHNSNGMFLPIVAPSDDTVVTNTITSVSPTDQNKTVTFGVSNLGGGYGNFLSLTGFNLFSEYAIVDFTDKNIAVPDYGGGWQSTMRDNMHAGRYNPAQAGYRNDLGALVSVVQNKNILYIPQFQMSLWDDGFFNFVQNESEEINDIFWYEDDNRSVKDDDGIDNEQHINEEILSAFDFSGKTIDAAEKFGIPSFTQREYLIYGRETPAMNQFTTPGIPELGLYGKGGVRDSKAKVFRTERRVKDVSLTDLGGIEGDQTPADHDFSDMVQTKSTRIDYRVFRYVFVPTLSDSGQYTLIRYDAPEEDNSSSGIICDVNIDIPDFTFASNNTRVFKTPRDRGERCEVDMPLVILSTHEDPTKGTGYGFYIPADSIVNQKQIWTLDLEAGEVMRREDRRGRAIMMVTKKTFPALEHSYFIVAHRNYLSGLLSPSSATKANGTSSVEAFVEETHYLFGTPEEILNAVVSN